MIRDQEETAEQQGAAPPREAGAPDALAGGTGTAPGPTAGAARPQGPRTADQGKQRREPAPAPATEKASTIEKAERPEASARPGRPTAPEPPERQQPARRTEESAPADASAPLPDAPPEHHKTADGAPGGPPRGGAHRAEGGPPDTGEFDVDRLAVDEPLLPARVHRPADLLRLLLGIAGIALVLALATFAHGTTQGLKNDIGQGAGAAPPLLINLAGLASSVLVLIVPVAYAVERLIKRDGLRIADGVLAAVLAHGVSLATDLWVAEAAPASIRSALTQPLANGALSAPVHSYLAPVIAYMTAVGMSRRPRWRVAMWCVLLLDAFAVLIGRYTTPFAIVVTVLIGWTVAFGTLYAVGSPNVRPTGQNLLAGLRRVGFRPVSARRAEDAGPEHADRGRRYLVTLEDGPPIDVTVVDREQQAQGFFYRVWRRLSLRGINQRRSLQSLRQALEQEALLAYAAIAAGAAAPKLIATSELGPDAVMLVYEHIGGRTFDQLADEEITDELMHSAWRQVAALQSRRIAHRRLVGDALLVDRSGNIVLTDLRGGEIAAGDLVLRMDIAQLLATCGLRVGAERAVAAAVEVLGPDAVADSLPLLQPIALSRTTRATLRQRARERSAREREAVLAASQAAKEARAQEAQGPQDRKALRAQRNAEKTAEKRALEEASEEALEEDLLAQIRRQVLLVRPTAVIEPAKLERLSPRILISWIAGAFAAYVLLSQLTNFNLGDVINQARWVWVLVAAFFSALTYVAAAMSLLGFVTEKVSFLRTLNAQVAGDFVKLVAPTAIGGVALNTRFLQRAGVRPGLAVASVGASQLFGLGSHIVLLLAFGYLTGTEHAPQISPSRTVIAGLLTVAVLVLVVTAVPVLRKFVVTRLRSLFAGVVPRMLDILQRPRKLVTGIGGMLLLTAANVMCLDASIRAFGGGDQISYAGIAVAFLAGNALGSAAPTPGGVGAVEAALIGALTFGGLPADTALPAVLLFRLMVFWLPVLPGWMAFTFMTRKGEI
ncbi:lysylphosphatidylglycerol synthase domain-containing protein [Streptomyces sp. RS10V-4]|uniref:lysylphosphatidylglycerol synthase transmembrane domain-containing protein n=1 Tax=Streptomyces rhizoryzae TaxID=2932493 RepID=UPI002005E23F|nr:lysylphosphatidylglycerol synthase transmembrane domain-containing protein [Streptomyces rhizoryzae]MCK7624086.1 lysylphosphatidylglycerol synthase domain-containing protein [Streptomyces rhizoryzae]